MSGNSVRSSNSAPAVRTTPQVRSNNSAPAVRTDAARPPVRTEIARPSDRTAQPQVRTSGRTGQTQVGANPSPANRDVNRDVNRDINRDVNRDINRDHNSDRWTRSNNNWNNNNNRNNNWNNNRNGNQWSNNHAPQWSRNYPWYSNLYGNRGLNGMYGPSYGNNFGMYGNAFTRPYTYFGNYYGNGLGYGYGYGSGLSSLIGLATGMTGFGMPGVGMGYGYGAYGGYGAFSPFGYSSNYSSGYSTPYIVDNSTTTQADAYVSAPNTSGDFLATGRSAFQSGDYAEAQRQANHAVIDTPQDAKAHELMMLSLFAQGEYQGATAAAHAVADLGQVPDWPTLYGYYKDRDKYVQHLGKLQQFVKEHPDAPEGRFLLGVNYQMIGDNQPAQKQFAEYAKLVQGDDPVAVKLFDDVGGDVNTLPKPQAPVHVNATSPATEDGGN